MFKKIESIHIDVEKGIYRINGEDIGAYHNWLEITYTPEYCKIISKVPLVDLMKNE